MCLGHTVWPAVVFVGFVTHTANESLLDCLPSIPYQTMRFQPHQNWLRSSGPDRSIALQSYFINMRIVLRFILGYYSVRNELSRNLRLINVLDLTLRKGRRDIWVRLLDGAVYAFTGMEFCNEGFCSKLVFCTK